jgi:predicted dinucleotide-binding enzyme
MKLGILGTGTVGTTIASKLVELGHEVRLGSRTKGNDKSVEWVKKAGARASEGTFADAASFGELVFNCTLGTASIDALQAAGSGNLKNKILIDTSNPLDFSKGMPPTLFTGNSDSLGEQIQRAFPETHVVKSLNTINCFLMVDPKRVAGGDHTPFMAGNDSGAKSKVSELLRSWFGWQHVLDLGDITASRGMESYLLLWLRLWGAVGSADFNVKVMR